MKNRERTSGNLMRWYTIRQNIVRIVRTHTALFCLLLAPLLTCMGCQLAQEDAAEDVAVNMVERGDRLAGVLITTDYLDLFDAEMYVLENVEDLDDGQINAEKSQEYNGRIYATLQTKTSTNAETGHTITVEEYVFPTIEGIEYFAYQITTDTGDIYTTSTRGQGLSDSKMHIHSTDQGDFITLDAVMYVAAQRKSVCYYFNPVYQDAEGNVYVTSGQGMESSMDSEGASFSQTINETRTVTQNGEDEAYANSVTVSVQVVYPPMKIVVLQMDQGNGVISRTEYLPEEMPDAVVPDRECEYILVESHKRTLDGKDIVTREVYGKDVDALKTLYEGESGICIQEHTDIEWNEEP